MPIYPASDPTTKVSNTQDIRPYLLYLIEEMVQTSVVLRVGGSDHRRRGHILHEMSVAVGLKPHPEDVAVGTPAEGQLPLTEAHRSALITV